MTPDVRTVRAEKRQIGAYRAAFVYQGPFKKEFSTASRVVNEVVLERPCACLGGWVFVGYIDEYGEEREASYPCRRCAASSR